MSEIKVLSDARHLKACSIAKTITLNGISRPDFRPLAARPTTDIKVNMAVVAPSGRVGRVTAMSPSGRTARVEFPSGMRRFTQDIATKQLTEYRWA